MENKKHTKRALFGSVIALILCCAMLIGTTFAWFTDSVTNGKNVIHAGNLDVSLWYSGVEDTQWGIGYSEENGVEVDEDTELFEKIGGGAILWEPGAVGQGTFRIKNDGELALKYAFTIKAYNAEKTADGHDLTEVLNVSAVEFNQYNESGVPSTDTSVDPYYDLEGKLLSEGYTIEGHLLPGKSVDYWMVIEWIPTNHDNDYNVDGGLDLDLCVELVATQYTYEKDSYNGDQYDAAAELPIASPIVNVEPTPYEGECYNEGTNVVSYKNLTLTSGAYISIDNTAPVAVENVTADVDGSVIVMDQYNPAIYIYGGNYTIDEGEYLIDASAYEGGVYQIFMVNVTVNGEPLTDANKAPYLNNVNWSQALQIPNE